MSDYLEIVAANAVDVDKNGRFPTESIDALRSAGLLAPQSPRDAARIVESLAQHCGSTAMITCMHYAASAVVQALGSDTQKSELAAGKHLGTLAFSEAGSRSHFWAPVSKATIQDDGVHLFARKSWVTSANHATFFVWSSTPAAAEGASSIWYVPAKTPGVASTGGFDGLGLRGNDSTPMVAEDAVIEKSALLGEDGGGLSVMLEVVLPLFNVMTASVAVGLMEGATQAACKHVSGTKYEHLDSTLADLPTIRAYLARMRIATDQARCLVQDTITAMETGREDVMLRVLECKAAAGESATSVLDLAMRVCGGAAFRREVGVERRFRDARAGTVMAPTTDQLYDFIGKAICGMEVF